MSCAVLKSELLAQRDRRHGILLEALAARSPSTLFVSLNVPGEEKSPPGAGELFEWGLAALCGALPGLRIARRGKDLLGPFAVLVAPIHPSEAKKAAMKVETITAAARLLDIDVYTRGGAPVGRRELSLPPRPCFLCPEPAAECMRLSRHDYPDLRTRIDELLRPFIP